MSTSIAAPSVLITGCSIAPSVGDSLAREYLKRGYTVFATARNVAGMKALGEAGCHLLYLDVTEPESITNAVKQVSEVTGGRLNILVNNAGVAGRAPLLDTDHALARKMYDVNVFGPLMVCQAFSPLLVRAAHDATKDTRAVIVNIGSIVAPTPGLPFNATYAASKAAFHSSVEALRFEMAPLGVKVMLVITGAVKTQFTAPTKMFNLQSAESTPSFYAHCWKNYDEAQQKQNMEITASSATVPQVFAEQVVRASLLASPPRRFYAGTGAWAYRWIMPWLPAFLTDLLIWKLFGMDLIKYNPKQD